MSTIGFLSLFFVVSWSLSTFNRVQTIPDLVPRKLAVSSQTQQFVLTTKTGELLQFSQSVGRFYEQQYLSSFAHEISLMDISPNGQWLMIVDVINYGIIYQYEEKIKKYHEVQNFSLDQFGKVTTLELFDGQSFAIGTISHMVFSLKFKDSLLQQNSIQMSSKIAQLFFNQDCSRIIVQTQAQVTIYSLPDFKLLKSFPAASFSSSTAKQLVLLQHPQLTSSLVKIIEGNSEPEKKINFNFYIDQIFVLPKEYVLRSKNQLIIYQRTSLQEKYRFEGGYNAEIGVGGNGEFIVLRDNLNVRIFTRQKMLLTENQEMSSGSIEWYWILIIVVSCFLLAVFVGIIIYEWGCKRTNPQQVQPIQSIPQNKVTSKEVEVHQDSKKQIGLNSKASSQEYVI